MRILLVNKFIFPKGGAETYTFDVGKMLEEHGHEVQYFGLENEKNIVGNRVGSYVTNMDFSQGIKANLNMRDGQYTKELWIDRRENSKSLAWSSVLLALNNIKEVGAVVDRPKALGDIRGVTYIYGMFYRFGLIDMPDKVNGKMKRAGRQM